MKTVAQIATSSKKFVRNHKTPITIVATATATAVTMRKLMGGALKEAYDFIEENGLTEKFIESTDL